MADTNYAELEDKKLLKLAEKREVKVKETTTREDIIAALEAQDAAEAEAKAKADAEAEAEKAEKAAKAAAAKAAKGEKVYYFIKSPVYATDETIMQRGLYQFDQENPRLDKQGERYVQKYVGKIPVTALVKIAEVSRVNAEEYSEEELLEILLTNPLA